MDITKRNLIVIVSAGLLGLTGVATIDAHGTQPVPPEKAQPTPPGTPKPKSAEGDWTPSNMETPVPSAFPEIKAPDPQKSNALPTLCPHLFKDPNPAPVEAADDTYRRLLKARLHQAVRSNYLFHARIGIGQFSEAEYYNAFVCLDEMRSVATELWAGDAKTLIPWLEEFVLMGKEWERFAETRYRSGAGTPQELSTARRCRLRAEESLWKAKNPKVGGR